MSNAVEKMVRATVARGRTVVIPDKVKKRAAGYDNNGKLLEAPALRHYGPGREVELPMSEVVELRKSGYLVDPDKIAKEELEDQDTDGEIR